MNDNTPPCSAEHEELRLQALANYQVLDTPEEAAERLHQLLSVTSMRNAPSTALYITASIGICALTDSISPDECLHSADELLYRAKQQGRNLTVCEVDTAHDKTVHR